MTKEELEKEAKTECYMLTVNTIGIDQRDVELAYVMGAEPREKRIAELKDDNKVMADNYSKMEQKFYDNLTKAKGLLIGFISKMKNSVYTPYEKDLIERAEQFISEVEK